MSIDRPLPTEPGGQDHETTRPYDVVVLGAGSGGYTAAIRSAQLGLRTAIVERDLWGGVCLNIGCIPSKALLRNAELADLLTNRTGEFGIHSDGPIRVDYAEAVARSRKVVDARVRGVHYLLRKNRVDAFDGHGRFTDANHLELSDPHSGQPRGRVAFTHCIIDVGATPNLLPGTAVSGRVRTYAEQISDPHLPSTMAIIGAGAIGVEFAYLLNCFGTKVTLLEAADRILPLEDADVSAELQRRFRRAGIDVRTGVRITELQDTPTHVGIRLSGPDGVPEHLAAEQVLQAIGFTPRTTGFGLERTGVGVSGNGAIAVDDYCRTSVEHIFAIGDVTARLMLAHVADTMGIVAAETIAGVPTSALTEDDFVRMPRATFCQPQAASFGLTEAQAHERGLAVTVSRFPFSANGKASGIGETAGFVKLISSQPWGELIGAHLIGPEVSELLPELTLAAQWDLTVNELVHNVHTHPTLSEAVKEAIHGLLGQAVNL